MLDRARRETEAGYRGLSYWHQTAGSLVPRPPLPGSRDADVAIVGAGYTGLWTAYYLSVAEPTLRIAVVERDIAGYGASGRNGGWCSALFPSSDAKVARVAARRGGDGPAQARALRRALQDTVDEVGRVADLESIDCSYAKGGTLVLARSGPQLRRAYAQVRDARAAGADPDDLMLLDPETARRRLAATGLVGATFTPHCAAVHPARLVRGLAAVVERRGVRIYEQTAARALQPGQVDTEHGVLRAAYVLRATEGYTALLPGARRAVAPVYSLVLATEPVSDDVWQQIGLAHRETFSDFRHLIIYGQRTADGRLVFGGRGAPYHFGSRISPAYDRNPAVFEALRRALVELFPALRDVAIASRWGGPLGIPRDWFASVGLDRHTGMGWAGGYVGDGVAAANLAGRTLADLVLGHDTDRTQLPWVGHRSRPWEPEPLRWLEANVGLGIMASADGAESRTGRPARRADWFGRFLGS